MIEESWLVEFVEKSADAGGLAFDIGANVGSFSALLAGKFAGVVAVEPDPRAFGFLSTLPVQNALFLHAAATSRNGAVEILMRPGHQQSSLLDEHPIGAADQEEAPIIDRVGVNAYTLDFLLFVARQRFGDMPLSFIKVDVEGAEGDVLAGATDPVFSRVRWLIEVHDRQAEVGEQLQRLGYDDIVVIPHPLPGAHPEHFWIYAEPPEAK